MLGLLRGATAVQGEPFLVEPPQVADERTVSCSVHHNLAHPSACGVQGVRLVAQAKFLVPLGSGGLPPLPSPFVVFPLPPGPGVGVREHALLSRGW